MLTASFKLSTMTPPGLSPFLVMALMWSAVTSLASGRGYRAAVYAHRPHFPPLWPVSRQTAVRYMLRNVRVYKEEAARAAQQGVQIIVFPEDGLYGMALSRALIRPYLEPIPDPSTTPPWIPCLDPAKVTPSDLLTQLSCMARENGLYVVANMGDIQPCASPTISNHTNNNIPTSNHIHSSSKSFCPPDGYFQFNTDVVFDANGTLVARYHKKHLFGEHEFDVPPSVEHVTFDTPFGRFGVFTCFDILFWDPAVKLVQQGVQSVVFPTAWMDEHPSLSALGFHSAWARGQGVNLLAANIQLPEFRFLGSGIYSPRGALAFYSNRAPGSRGRLVIADVPLSPRMITQIPKRSRSTNIDFDQNSSFGIMKSVRSEVRERGLLGKRWRKKSQNLRFILSQVETGRKTSSLRESLDWKRFTKKSISWKRFFAGDNAQWKLNPEKTLKLKKMMQPFSSSAFLNNEAFTKTLKGFLTQDLHSKSRSRSIMMEVDSEHFDRDKDTDPEPFEILIHDNLFKMVELKEASGALSLCYRGTCCSLQYEDIKSSTGSGGQKAVGVVDGDGGDLLVFGVSSGVHNSSESWWYEACVVVTCGSHAHSSCARPSFASSTTFSFLTMSGSFSTRFIYPEVVVLSEGQMALTPADQWTFTQQGVLKAK